MPDGPLAPHDLSVGAPPFKRCPTCDDAFSPTVWLVLDLDRHPDLLATIQTGALFKFRCGACHETIDVNSPVLVVQAQSPRIVFSPCPGTTNSIDDHNQLTYAIELLSRSIGPPWRDSVMDELVVVPRALLPQSVGPGAPGRPTPEALLAAFAQADTGWKQQYMLAAYPALFETETDTLLERQIAQAREKRDAVEVAAMRARRGLLANCRDARAATIKSLLPSPRAYAPAAQLNRLLLSASQALRSGKAGAAMAEFSKAGGMLKACDNPLLWAEIQAILAQVDAPGGPANSASARRSLEAVATASFPCGPWLAISARCRAELAALCAARRQSSADDVIAIRHYEAVIESLEALGDPYALVRACGALGFLHYQRTDGDRSQHLQAALRCYQTASQQLERDVDPSNWSAIQFNIGDAYLQLESGDRSADLDQAVAHLERAAVVQSKLADQARFQETNERLQTAYAARSILAISHDPRSKDLSQAVSALDKRDWACALEAYGSAIAQTEQMLASTYRLETRREVFDDFGTAYSAAAYCLFRLGRFGEAVTMIEDGRNRMISEEVQAFDLIEERVPPALRDELNKVRGFMRTMRTTKFMTKRDNTKPNAEEMAESMNRDAWLAWLAVLEKIKVEAPDALRAPLEERELLSLIPEGGALVLPVFSIAGCCALVASHGRDVIDHDDLLWIDDFTDNHLLELMLAWSAAQNSDDRAERRQSVASVCERLWPVLAERVAQRLDAFGLAAGAPVIWLPQGGLGLLPMHAAAPKADSAGGLLDRYAVAYAPSAYLLSVMRRRVSERAAQTDSFLGVVDPLGDLDYSRAEGALVMSLFGADQSLLLAGEAASGTRLRDAVKDRTYIHFSCHAYYTTDGGNYSGLMLAPDPVTDSSEHMMAAFEGRPALKDFFLAGERWIVSSLDLTKSRLVTLSACDSGRVDVRRPDEFFGLPAAFLRAGAAAVLSTLWRVDDAAGMLISRRFYEGLVNDRLSPAAALRAAQVWLRDATNSALYDVYGDMRDQGGAPLSTAHLERESRRHAFGAPGDRPYKDPYFWAAFVVFASG